MLTSPVKYDSIGSDNCLPLNRRQAIIWTTNGWFFLLTQAASMKKFYTGGHVFFLLLSKNNTKHNTVNSWVHWQTWKRHWGILAVQKHNVTEQTNKTRHSTTAMRQNLMSDDFSLDLLLLANHAKYTNIYRDPAYVMTITLQYSTNECLKKGVSPQFYCCTDAFSTFDLNSWCARIVIPIS